MAERIRTIRLYGQLGARFGRVHRLAVGSAKEAIRALGVIHADFNRFMTESKDMGLVFAVFYGKRNLGLDQLHEPPSDSDIRIAPIVQGSKSGGVLQVALGIALIAVATIATGGLGLAGGLAIGGAGWGIVGTVGLSLAIGGVAQMITGTTAGIDSSEAANNQPSYNFSGIKNTVTQGNPVSLCYGEMTVGSANISTGIVAEDEQ